MQDDNCRQGYGDNCMLDSSDDEDEGEHTDGEQKHSLHCTSLQEDNKEDDDDLQFVSEVIVID